MPFVEYGITFQSVFVIEITMGTHLHSVTLKEVSSNTFILNTNFFLHSSKYLFKSFSATPARPEIIDPCRPSPCGVNAECRERNQAAACTCLPGLFGNPYIECKPECTINQECASNLACMQNKCRDPCPGVCGIQATCEVNNHYPICKCNPGYTGDPFTSCSLKTTRKSFYIVF